MRTSPHGVCAPTWPGVRLRFLALAAAERAKASLRFLMVRVLNARYRLYAVVVFLQLAAVATFPPMPAAFWVESTPKEIVMNTQIRFITFLCLVVNHV